MKLSAIAVGVALLASATSASAASLFDVFDGMCLNTGGNPEMALDRAKAFGWPEVHSELMRALVAPSERGEIITDARGRGVSDLRGTLALFVARTSRMIVRQEIPAQTCIVAAGPSIDGKAVAADAAAYAGVPGRLGLAFQKGAMGYLWREAGSKHIPLEPQDVVSANLSSDVKMLVVITIKGTSVLEFFVPVKEPN